MIVVSVAIFKNLSRCLSLMSRTICLGIESTAHTFGIGIVEAVKKKGKLTAKVLANEKDVFTTVQGGMIPGDVAAHHYVKRDEVLASALSKAKLSLKDISLISVSRSPGLSPCLVAGMETAKSLAKKRSVPLIGVNHCVAHLEIGRALTKTKEPVLLYCSGVNTQVIAFEGNKYRIFGETLDIGVGNFLDSFARHAGIGFPGGPKIERLALDYRFKNELLALPYNVKGMDVNFGGLLTNVCQKYDQVKSGKYSMEQLAFAIQETAFAMLIEVAERAMAHLGRDELLLGGGVACNSRLQEMARRMCKDRGAECFVPERQFLVDNGAMIAWLGLLGHDAGIKQNISRLDINPYERTDDVIVSWR